MLPAPQFQTKSDVLPHRALLEQGEVLENKTQIPILNRTAGGLLSRDPNAADTTSSRPAISRSRVLLPEPEGPSRATKEPLSTSRLTASTAREAPNCLLTPARRMPMDGRSWQRLQQPTANSHFPTGLPLDNSANGDRALGLFPGLVLSGGEESPNRGQSRRLENSAQKRDIAMILASFSESKPCNSSRFRKPSFTRLAKTKRMLSWRNSKRPSIP